MPFARTPQEVPLAFLEAWNARDAAALSSLFYKDAEFVNVVGLWWHDRVAIEKAHHYGLSTFFRQSELSLIRSQVKMLHDDIAVAHAHWRLTGQLDKDDTPLDERQTIMVFVVKKIDDGWGVIAAQNTDIVPGAETFRSKDKQLDAITYRA